MPDDQPTGRPVYSIGAVSRMLGVPAATLRTWQERYGVVVPERSEGGHRLYTRDQVEQLRFMVDRVAAGLSPADGHRLLAARLAAGEPLDLQAGGGGDQVMILLVEADPFGAEFAEYFLRTEGYRVVHAVSASDATARAAELAPQLAVVDLLISGGQGLKLCQLLQERTGVPVLAIATLELRDDAMAVGASAFLRKPVDPLQLVSVVQDLLGRSAFLRRPATGEGVDR